MHAWHLAALLAGSTVALASCGVGAAARDTGENGMVGISMPTQSKERWVDDGHSMVTQFRQEGYGTDLQYAEDVVEDQIAQIENMIAKDVDVLVVAPIDGNALGDVVQRAADSGIPVISYDRLIRGSDNVDYYATFDNHQVGVLQGRYIEHALGLDRRKGPFSIELFSGSPDDNNSAYFFDGAMSVLRPHIEAGDLRVVSGQTSMEQTATLRWDGENAQSRMDDLLSAHYAHRRLDAVLAPADSVSVGILSSLKGVGYGSGDTPMPVVTGQDAEVPAVKSIARGEQSQTVFKDTRKLADVAVDMTDAVATGERPRVNDTTTYDNGEEVVPSHLLQPVSVDRDNYEEELVDSGYYEEGELS